MLAIPVISAVSIHWLRYCEGEPCFGHGAVCPSLERPVCHGSAAAADAAVGKHVPSYLRRGRVDTARDQREVGLSEGEVEGDAVARVVVVATPAIWGDAP